MKRLWLWFKRWFNPWLCPKCGKDMERVRLDMLPVDVQRQHIQARTAWMLPDCYRCKDGCLGDNIVMIL